VKPLNDFTRHFVSFFQCLEEEHDFRRVDISWVAEQIDLSKIFFLANHRSFWDKWKQRLLVVSKAFGHTDLHD